MGKVTIVFFVLCLTGCKKNYNCHCNTIDVRQGFVNDLDYTVKERNKTEALYTCAKKYNNSGLATGGINCEVK